jgi:hypothetical protein
LIRCWCCRLQIRKVIAQRLVESKTSIPGLYASVDVRLDALGALRKQLAAQGVKLSVNDFVLKAVAAALQEVGMGLFIALLIATSPRLCVAHNDQLGA